MQVRAIKVNDSDQVVSVGSRAHQYWSENGYQQYFKSLRPGIKIPAGLNHNNIDSIVKQFKLKGISFGNWVTIEDRLNYLHALFISFYDLNKVLRFSYNLGMNGNLTVTFGDRGIPGSLAHFNGGTILININRYERGPEEKLHRFLNSGGVHSFAHEYMHFLDMFAGAVLEQHRNYFYCSGGHSISRSRVGLNTPIRSKIDDILHKIIWAKGGGLTPYYKKMVKQIEATDGLGDYWIRRTELLARAFEAYISFELKEMGIKNQFLTKTRYESWFYLPPTHLKQIVPDFRQLIQLIRKRIQ